MSYLVKKGLMMQGAAASTLLNNIVSYWKLDDLAGNAIDSLGLNNGTVVGCTQGVTGKINTAYSFNGLNNYIDIDNLVNDISNNTAGTISAWIKPVDATPAEKKVIFRVYDGDATNYIMFDLIETGQIRGICQAVVGGVKWQLTTNNQVANDNTWLFILLTHNGTQPIIYINGSAVAQTFITDNDRTYWFNSLPGLDNAIIGRVSDAGARVFEGVLDEIGIWSRNLTTDEITELYNSGAGNSYPF